MIVFVIPNIRLYKFSCNIILINVLIEYEFDTQSYSTLLMLEKYNTKDAVLIIKLSLNVLVLQIEHLLWKIHPQLMCFVKILLITCLINWKWHQLALTGNGSRNKAPLAWATIALALSKNIPNSLKPLRKEGSYQLRK